MSKVTVKQIREAVMCCQVSRQRNGLIRLRKSYFYTNSKTDQDFMTRVEHDLKVAGLEAKAVDCGTVWEAFKGGAKVAKQSHWWVDVEVA